MNSERILDRASHWYQLTHKLCIQIFNREPANLSAQYTLCGHSNKNCIIHIISHKVEYMLKTLVQNIYSGANYLKRQYKGSGLVTNYGEGGQKTGGGGACEVLHLQKWGGGGTGKSFSHAEGGSTTSFGVVFTW